MQLIGMLDSPYVRRVAIALRSMQLPFEHASISVFRGYDAFAAINPVVKAPTLVTDEGVVLMDSQLILDYAARLVPAAQRLPPQALADFVRHQRLMGLALAACEKSVSLVYERDLRPEERRHAPWIERVEGQLAQACALLEAELPATDAWLFAPRASEACITVAVAWGFIAALLPERAAALAGPRLRAFSAWAEATPAFAATPMF
ncbi:MAG: glutathione S-transferase [Hyphomicrobiaceae bacterium]|nr:glutathione S-transferase [Hyphomicrobiaceae bacterium]